MLTTANDVGSVQDFSMNMCCVHVKKKNEKIS